MLKLVCSIFSKCNIYQISPYFMNNENLDPWMMLFKELLEMAVPEELGYIT